MEGIPRMPMISPEIKYAVAGLPPEFEQLLKEVIFLIFSFLHSILAFIC